MCLWKRELLQKFMLKITKTKWGRISSVKFFFCHQMAAQVNNPAARKLVLESWLPCFQSFDFSKFIQQGKREDREEGGDFFPPIDPDSLPKRDRSQQLCRLPKVAKFVGFNKVVWRSFFFKCPTFSDTVDNFRGTTLANFFSRKNWRSGLEWGMGKFHLAWKSLGKVS